jgi:hypothetical protein
LSSEWKFNAAVERRGSEFRRRKVHRKAGRHSPYVPSVLVPGFLRKINREDEDDEEKYPSLQNPGARMILPA